jgi:hypothetical protein
VRTDTKSLAARSWALRDDIERAIRSFLPRRQASSPLPRVLAGVALAAAGAAAALCLAPRTGAETRASARRHWNVLQRRARAAWRKAPLSNGERTARERELRH